MRQGWLDSGDSVGTLPTQILQDRTQYILKQLNFEWAPISTKAFGSYIKNVIKPSIVGYMDKMLHRKRILEHLERVAEILPTPAYWFDLKQRYLGVNSLVVKGVAATSFEKDFANKTPHDIFPYEMAENIVKHHKTAIKKGITLSAPEAIKNRLGEIKYLNATIAPL